MSHDELYGAGIDAYFPEGGSPVRPAPWPRAGRRKDRQDYDPAVVHSALSEPPRPEMVDPRNLNLRSTQPNVTAPGVNYYATGQWEQTGETFADNDNPGNRFPVVYRRHEGNGKTTDLLLSGHHRGTAALLQGRQFPAITVEGGWGPARNRS